MKRISIQLVILSMLFLGCCAGVFAQATSQISGTVKDASGGAIAGAQITVTQTDTGVSRTATSDAGGVYSLPSLPLGPYRMEVKKEGFTTYLQSGIVLQVASAPTIDPLLQVGVVSQTVQVEAAAAMIETSSTGVGQVVNSQDVVDLPLNGRQVTQLITLAGASNTVPYGFGASPSVGNLVSSKNYPNEALVSVGGGLLNGTTYLLDGGTYNDPFNNLNLPTPFPDAIQEFNVQTSALPAQYGQHSAGAINMVSKSGTNQFSRRRVRIRSKLGFQRPRFLLLFTNCSKWRERQSEAQSVRRHLRRADQEEQGVLFPGLSGHVDSIGAALHRRRSSHRVGA